MHVELATIEQGHSHHFCETPTCEDMASSIVCDRCGAGRCDLHYVCRVVVRNRLPRLIEHLCVECAEAVDRIAEDIA